MKDFAEMDNIELTKWQQSVVDDESEVVFAVGGAGCGKTTAMLHKCHKVLSGTPGSKILLLLRKRHAIMHVISSTIGKVSGVKHVRSKRRFVYPNGSFLEYDTWYNQDKTAAKIKSTKHDAVWLVSTSVSEFTKDEYDEILHRSRSAEARQLWLEGTPGESPVKEIKQTKPHKSDI